MQILQVLLYAAIASIGACIVGVISLSIYLRRRRPSKHTVAFFHPYCNDGGGGERVLWRAIDALQLLDPEDKVDIVVYSGDKGVTGRDILQKAKERFDIVLRKEPKFVFLSLRHLVEASRYPVFTMFGQSLASVILGLEALFKLTPHTYIDSMGYSWTFPIFAILGGAYVASYVHYPTISTDMLSRVTDRSAIYNNDEAIASSGWKTRAKITYYQLFALIYGMMGRFSRYTMVNSSWTKGHIQALWSPKILRLVYPPCDTNGLQKLPLEGRRRERMVSIAQFRPEKNHFLQISIVESLVKEHGLSNVELNMLGSVRVGNEGDLELVKRLRREIEAKGLLHNITLTTGVSNAQLKQFFASSAIGLHTMNQEHFGIGVVELQAAGVVPVAHDSAGPKMDIVLHDTGRLASSSSEYASSIASLIKMPALEFDAIAKRARENAHRFSDQAFVSSIQHCFLEIPGLNKWLTPL